MNGWRRTGGFLNGLGIFLLILFVLSDTARQPDFGLLGAGVGVLGIGIFLLVTHPVPELPPDPRFRLFRRRKDEPHPSREASAPPPAPAKAKLSLFRKSSARGKSAPSREGEAAKSGNSSGRGKK